MKERFDDYEERIMDTIEQRAKKLEKEIGEDPDLTNLHPEQTMDQKVYQRIDEYEALQKLSERDREALRLGRELQKRGVRPAFGKPTGWAGLARWKRVAAVLVVCVVTLSVGVTSMGGPKRIVEMVEQLVGDREVVKISSSTGDIKIAENEEEAQAYQDIKDELGIQPVRILVVPGKMRYQFCEVDPELRTAYMLYQYDESNVSYILNCNYSEDTWGMDVEDQKSDEYTYPLKEVEVAVTEYPISESEKKYLAEFEYRGVQYQLIATMNQQDFEEILDNLHFS